MVRFYEFGDIPEGLLKFAVIVSVHGGKWVFCRHRDRDTLEIPGGHVEAGEAVYDTAVRELREETGALRFDIKRFAFTRLFPRKIFEGRRPSEGCFLLTLFLSGSWSMRSGKFAF